MKRKQITPLIQRIRRLVRKDIIRKRNNRNYYKYYEFD